jgi:hypothetical protein
MKDCMLEVKLPFVMDETLRCYLCNAFWGGILSAYQNMEEWIVEHYIQMFYVSNRFILNTNQIESQLNYYGGWSEPMKLFEQQLVRLGDIKNYDIVNELSHALEQGYYCYTYINEKYVGNKQDTAHDVFVIGKNDRTKKFKVIGYFNSRYSSIEMDYELMMETFASGLTIALSSNNAIDDYVKLYKPLFNDKTVYHLKLSTLILRTQEYLDSTNTGMLKRSGDINHGMYEMPNSYYGLSMYTQWIEELAFQGSKLGEVDYRKFHAVYEHKLMMSRRVGVLERKYGTLFNHEKKMLREIIHFLEVLRMLALKYNNSRKKENFENILQKISVLHDLDKEFMMQFLATLKKI